MDVGQASNGMGDVNGVQVGGSPPGLDGEELQDVQMALKRTSKATPTTSEARGPRIVPDSFSEPVTALEHCLRNLSSSSGLKHGKGRLGNGVDDDEDEEEEGETSPLTSSSSHKELSKLNTESLVTNNNDDEEEDGQDTPLSSSHPFQDESLPPPPATHQSSSHPLGASPLKQCSLEGPSQGASSPTQASPVR